MTTFLLLSILLAALALALLLRRPAARAAGDGATVDDAIAATRPSRGLALALAGVVAIVAIGGYAWVGSPTLMPVTPGAMNAESPNAETAAAGEAMARALEARAQKHPTEPVAWFQYARAELALGHVPEAVQGYRRALALRPNDPDLLADAADVFAVAAGGKLAGEPMQLVDRALAADPNNVKALALKGSWLVTQHDLPGALAAWEHVLKSAQPDDPIAAFVGHQIEALRAMAAGGSPAAAAPPGAEPAASGTAPRTR